MSHSTNRPYYSFLLRLWAESDGDRWVWRASLESILTGERLGFPSLEALIAFLQDQIAAFPEPSSGQEEDDR